MRGPWPAHSYSRPGDRVDDDRGSAGSARCVDPRVVIVSAVEENDTVFKVPHLGHLQASSVIATEAISILESGLLGEGAESTPAVCEVGGSNEPVGIRPKA